MTTTSRSYFRRYTAYEWRIAALLVVSYIVVSEITAYFVPASGLLYPASAIGLAALFFGGRRLWPVLYVSALAVALLAHVPLPFLIFVPVGEVLLAVAGSYIFTKTRLDPLFRKYRDIFYLITTILLISLITPTIAAFAGILQGTSYSSTLWSHQYVATLFCLLVLTPFLLRWFAKIRFSRPPIELVEIVFIFIVLICIDCFLFVANIPTVFDIRIAYLLLIPLFWIALRLRPRFITLALVITSILAVSSVLGHGHAAFLTERLFGAETLLIVLTVVCFIVTSLEEDRRLNTNLMRSQLSTLENAIARISSESSAKNDFIAILAHELRNPLAPVVSAIEILKLKGSHDKEDVETFAMMEDRMNTVRRLLDDLLDISRISEGKILLKKETLDLGSVIRQALLSTEHYRKERHQPLVLKLPKMPLHVSGDPVRLEQVFSNLLTNASKYSDSGDSITVTLRESNGMAEVEIIDKGVGISAQALETIFVPFQQVDLGERSKKGLGIGLALVRSFVEMHGGTVSATSRGTRLGSSFSIQLPLLLFEAQTDAKKKNAQSTSTSKNKGGLFVLVVDDNDAAAGGIGRLLELNGCRIAYAYDGEQAIEKALRMNPDVVLLDVGLPDQDGYTVAKTLRVRGYEGRLVALTGFSTDEARERGKGAGFDHYLIKPAGIAELKSVLPELT